MAVVEVSKKIAAPRQLVWQVVSDGGRYAEFAPNIRRSWILEGEGVGMKRRCEDDRGSWTEVCRLWEEGHRFRWEVDTASGYPHPLRRVHGTWTVEDDGDATRLTVRLDYRISLSPAGPILGRLLMRPTVRSVFGRLLDNWEREILSLQSGQAPS